ncbi:MAG: flagellar protein FlaG [Thermodesulfobacteriota bacterium]|nr:flagellar protein FlaG [Thermodesulfobacteriota bacterium]
MDEVTAVKFRVTDPVTARPATEKRTTTARAAPNSRSKPPEQVDVDKAVEQLQDYAAQHDINLRFSVHKATGQTIIKVVDAKTNKVVREIPPEEILNLKAYLKQIAGHLLSTEV